MCKTESDKAIQCDEANWHSIANSVESRYLGLMLEQGGANVHLGMMYFDSQDNIDVFSHEISHLLGFVDEYPLAKYHQKCQQPQLQPFSHNIVVLKSVHHGARKKVRKKILKTIPWAKHISEKTPILQRVLGKELTWQLGTPENQKGQTGVFVAESCDNSVAANKLNFRAYKPLTKRTQLRYFSSYFPDEYLAMLGEPSDVFLMPSFHYNIALAFYQQGNISEAKRWLEQAVLWEESPERIEKVRRGAF